MKELNLEASKSLTSNRSLIIQHFIMYCCTLYIGFNSENRCPRPQNPVRQIWLYFIASSLQKNPLVDWWHPFKLTCIKMDGQNDYSDQFKFHQSKEDGQKHMWTGLKIHGQITDNLWLRIGLRHFYFWIDRPLSTFRMNLHGSNDSEFHDRSLWHEFGHHIHSQTLIF